MSWEFEHACFWGHNDVNFIYEPAVCATTGYGFDRGYLYLCRVCQKDFEGEQLIDNFQNFTLEVAERVNVL
jgi:hypothetical protein